MHATPGNFFDSLRLNPQISQETVDRYEKLYHLNDPLLVQYAIGSSISCTESGDILFIIMFLSPMSWAAVCLIPLFCLLPVYF